MSAAAAPTAFPVPPQSLTAGMLIQIPLESKKINTCEFTFSIVER